MLRPLRLASIAARAESLRSRCRAKRVATEIVYAIGALLVLLVAVFWLNVALWYWLRGMFNHEEAALIIGGGDVVLAAILGGFAARSGPSHTEDEAREVRDIAIRDAPKLPRMAGSLGPWLPILLRFYCASSDGNNRRRTYVIEPSCLSTTRYCLSLMKISSGS